MSYIILNIRHFLFLSLQVDKGVVPLAGTNGETTTQGRRHPKTKKNKKHMK